MNVDRSDGADGLVEPNPPEATAEADGADRSWRGSRWVDRAWWLLVAGGVALRLPGLTDPPNHSSPMRQYHVGLIARSMSRGLDRGIPEWSRSVARDAADRAGILEVPILPAVAALVNTALGSGEERWWPMKLLVAAAWVVGACCMRSVAGQLTGSPRAGFAGGAVFLLIPFGLELSRSIQPDALMVSLVVIGWWALLRADREQTTRSLAIVGVVLGLASAAKGVGLFFTLPMVAALGVQRVGVRGVWRDRTVRVGVGAAVVPAVVLYVASLFGGVLGGQLASSSIPSLLVTSKFWAGWVNMTFLGIGLVGVVVTAAGAFLAPRRLRLVMGFVFIGYLAYGMVFSYRTFTHPYYSLPIVLLVSLGASGAVWGLCERPGRSTIAAAAGYLMVVASILMSSPWPSDAYRPGFSEDYRDTARSIGEYVGHSERVVVLTDDYCMGPFYEAEISGWCWPNNGDLQLGQLMGETGPTARERLDGLVGEGATWFIVDDAEAFRGKPFDEFGPLFAALEQYGQPTKVGAAEIFRLN